MVYLTGMMGSGKTTTGKSLALSLKLPFIDLDRKIEEKYKKSITDLFLKENEIYFRKLESNTLHDSTLSGVISCGGGILEFKKNCNYLMKTGIVFFLHTSIDEIYSRIKNANNRPLLNTKNKKKRIETIWNKRKELYFRYCHHKIETDNKTIDEIVEEIKIHLKK